MRRYCFLLCSSLLLSAFSLPGAAREKSGRDSVPSIIRSPSLIGEVVFPHREHFEEFEIECEECHHETHAARLELPHPEYFDDFWIDCRICHRGSSPRSSLPRSCSECHHSSPVDIADESLGAKVVIHERCWTCHSSGKGAEAGRSCRFCHSGKRTGFGPDGK